MTASCYHIELSEMRAFANLNGLDLTDDELLARIAAGNGYSGRVFGKGRDRYIASLFPEVRQA